MRKPPAWLDTAVFYYVFPASFYDANGDGIGDLPGIALKLDYIQSLGCNALWITPCFVSPFNDGGYDVADYYRIAPRYGTNADMRRLLSAARQRGIHICLDLVAGHTSTQHPWFKKSCEPKENPYWHRYIWTGHFRDRGEGSGLQFIRGYALRDGNYAANFYYTQPALNYGFYKPDPAKRWQLPMSHPAVRANVAELKKIMRFWLGMGVSGFRVDMAHSLVKADPERRGTASIWREVRRMFDRDYPGAALIAEWGKPHESLPAGFHGTFTLGFDSGAKGNYAFLSRTKFLSKLGRGDVQEFLGKYLDGYRRTKDIGFSCIVSSLHDTTRPATDRTTDEMTVAFAFQMTMPGVPFIYYGDEIGMVYLKGLISKDGAYLRTGSRTPMQWSSAKNAGFSSAPVEKLYLPVDRRRPAPNVAAQEEDQDSLLNRVRRLIQLRLACPALQARGELKIIYAEPKRYPLVYLRYVKGERVLVVINPSGRQYKLRFRIAGAADQPVCLLRQGVNLSARHGDITASAAGVAFGIFRV
jgi:maltose alpha-D-glucosyltransferase/alpha-amylase